MSKLNPNAGEWVPTYVITTNSSPCTFCDHLPLFTCSFVSPIAVASPTNSLALASPLEDETFSNTDMLMLKQIEIETSSAAAGANQKMPLERGTEFGHELALDENGQPISYVGEFSFLLKRAKLTHLFE